MKSSHPIFHSNHVGTFVYYKITGICLDN